MIAKMTDTDTSHIYQNTENYYIYIFQEIERLIQIAEARLDDD